MRLSLLLLVLAACGTNERDISAKSRVVPKSGEVWGRDLARALALDEASLCKELGSFDCIRDAHRVTLGGTEPERLGVDTPLPDALVSAPIAFDRVALSACGERFARDEEGPTVVFGPVMKGDSKSNRKKVGTALVQRVLSREPTKADLESFELLHDRLEDVSTDLTRDWAIGTCVIVSTSTEALFY